MTPIDNAVSGYVETRLDMNDAGNVMGAVAGNLDPSMCKAPEETVAPGQRHPPRKAPTKKLITPGQRRAKRKAAKASRKRNRI